MYHNYKLHEMLTSFRNSHDKIVNGLRKREASNPQMPPLKINQLLKADKDFRYPLLRVGAY